MARKGPVEDKPKVAPWMMSFSDMMTNMLCFFILMVSLATQQQAGFVQTGIGHYLEKLNALGMPGLMPSQRTLIPRDHPLARYQPPRADPLDDENWVEHTRQMLHEEFDRLSRSESRLETPVQPLPVPLGLTFSRMSDRLTLKDRQNLDVLIPSLQERSGLLEVTGFCEPAEAGTQAERLRLSLQRSRAVVRYLEQAGIPSARLFPRGAATSPPSRERAGGGSRPAGRKVTMRWLRQE